MYSSSTIVPGSRVAVSVRWTVEFPPLRTRVVTNESFSIVNACSGVFVRTRRTVQDSRLVASNVMNAGYGELRRIKV